MTERSNNDRQRIGTARSMLARARSPLARMSMELLVDDLEAARRDAPAEPVTGVHRKVDRAAAEALAQAPVVLATCGHTVRPTEVRRTLCRTCYKKLLAAGCELPPRGSRWDDHDVLAAWAQALPDAVRARLLAALSPPVPVTVPAVASPDAAAARTVPEEPAS